MFEEVATDFLVLGKNGSAVTASKIVTANTFTLLSFGKIIENPIPILLGSYTVANASTASLASFAVHPNNFNLSKIVSLKENPRCCLIA